MAVPTRPWLDRPAALEDLVSMNADPLGWMNVALEHVAEPAPEPEPVPAGPGRDRDKPPRAAHTPAARAERAPKPEPSRPDGDAKPPSGTDAVTGSGAATTTHAADPSEARSNAREPAGGLEVLFDDPASAAMPTESTGSPDPDTAAPDDTADSLTDLFGDPDSPSDDGAEPSTAFPAAHDDGVTESTHDLDDLFADDPAVPTITADEPELRTSAGDTGGGLDGLFADDGAPAPGTSTASTPPDPILSPTVDVNASPQPNVLEQPAAPATPGGPGAAAPDDADLRTQVWFPDGWDSALSALADRAQHENWNSGCAHESAGTGDRYDVLAHYLRHTFRRLAEEDKAATTDGPDGPVHVFHTGLYTDDLEPLFGVSDTNPNPGREPWRWREWATPTSHRLRSIDVRQLRPAFYFTEPGHLVYDPRLPLVTDLDRIVDHDVDRYPAPLRTNQHQRRLLLDAAIRNAGTTAARDWRVAVPQYYRHDGTGPGRIQLLLPLCLSAAHVPDLALAVDRTGDRYQAHKVLTLPMARTNARVLARPTGDWLAPPGP